MIYNIFFTCPRLETSFIYDLPQPYLYDSAIYYETAIPVESFVEQLSRKTIVVSCQAPQSYGQFPIGLPIQGLCSAMVDNPLTTT